MINYNKIITQNNQIINILENYNNTDDYLLFIFFTCCMVGGYESYDYIVHLLVYNISNSISSSKLDLSLYYPIEVNIKDRMNDTIKYYNFYSIQEKTIINDFIKKIKN